MKSTYLKPTITALVLVPLLAVVIAIWQLWNQYVFWDDIVLMTVLYSLNIVGIGVGYHRMLTHSGFRAPSWLRFFFISMGAMAFEGSPAIWAATHIKHHAHSDEEDDPHSPLDGFWHAHLGWLYDHSNFETLDEYAPHLRKDKVTMFIHKYIWAFYVLSLAIPFAIGGWTGLVWAGGVRIFLVTHVTWSVNSICHTFGKRDYETTDESRNHFLIGLLAFGEGWHNNHHAFPSNAFHGMRWYQFDLSGIIIRGLEMVGLISQVQRVSDEVVMAHIKKSKTMLETVEDMKHEFSKTIDVAHEELKKALQDVPKDRLVTARDAYVDAMYAFAKMQQRMKNRRMIKKAAFRRNQQKVAQLVASVKEQLHPTHA